MPLFRRSTSIEGALNSLPSLHPDLLLICFHLVISPLTVNLALPLVITHTLVVEGSIFLGIRSLFSSAHADDWTRLRAEPAKPLGWLGKPYGRMEFLRALGMAVGHLEEHSIRG